MISQGFLGNLGSIKSTPQSYVQAYRGRHVLDAAEEAGGVRGLHITLGGGFNTSQISQKPLGNHENPLFFMDFQ